MTKRACHKTVCNEPVRAAFAIVVQRAGGINPFYRAHRDLLSRPYISALRAGKPMRPSTWTRVVEAVMQIDSTLIAKCRERRPKIAPQRRCSCGKRVYGVDTLCYKCRRDKAGEKNPRARHQCPHCGQVGKEYVDVALCCLRRPDAIGHCGWCGDDCDRAFCSPPCSASYQSDVTRGEAGEAMVRDDHEGATNFSAASWAT